MRLPTRTPGCSSPASRSWRPVNGIGLFLRHLLEATGTAGNLTADAHIAALALERGAAVCSSDHDCARFPGIRHVSPSAAG